MIHAGRRRGRTSSSPPCRKSAATATTMSSACRPLMRPFEAKGSALSAAHTPSPPRREVSSRARIFSCSAAAVAKIGLEAIDQGDAWAMTEISPLAEARPKLKDESASFVGHLGFFVAIDGHEGFPGVRWRTNGMLVHGVAAVAARRRTSGVIVPSLVAISFSMWSSASGREAAASSLVARAPLSAAIGWPWHTLSEWSASASRSTTLTQNSASPPSSFEAPPEVVDQILIAENLDDPPRQHPQARLKYRH